MKKNLFIVVLFALLLIPSFASAQTVKKLVVKNTTTAIETPLSFSGWGTATAYVWQGSLLNKQNFDLSVIKGALNRGESKEFILPGALEFLSTSEFWIGRASDYNYLVNVNLYDLTGGGTVEGKREKNITLTIDGMTLRGVISYELNNLTSTQTIEFKILGL